MSNGSNVRNGGDGRPQVTNPQQMMAPNPLDSGIAAFNDGFSGGFGAAY